MTENRLSPVRDTVEAAARIQQAYDLSEERTVSIMAAGSPYAHFMCTVIDIAFGKIVDAAQRQHAGQFTADSVAILGDLVVAALKMAHETRQGADYLNALFLLLGDKEPSFPPEFDYVRALPGMWLLVPRLAQIKREGMIRDSEATTA